MIILGIDVGLAKTGVARAEGSFAEPLTVIHEKNVSRLVSTIQKLAAKEEAEKVVIGIPEGTLVTFVNEIGDKLMNLGVNVEFHDETLTTRDAQTVAIDARMPQQKRRGFEDAIAAAVMLQSYLDGY